jgi:hypothetical protein
MGRLPKVGIGSADGAVVGLPQLPQRSGGLAADGAGGAAEDVGDLLLGQVLEVAQDDDGPLPGRQRGDGGAQLQPYGRVLSQVAAVGAVGEPLGGVLGPPAPPAPGRAELAVEHPAHVVLGHAVDGAPPRGGLGQGALHQVFGRVLVTAEHVRAAQQRVRALGDELCELAPLAIVHPQHLLRIQDAGRGGRLARKGSGFDGGGRGEVLAGEGQGLPQV